MASRQMTSSESAPTQADRPFPLRHGEAWKQLPATATRPSESGRCATGPEENEARDRTTSRLSVGAFLTFDVSAVADLGDRRRLDGVSSER